MSEIEKSIALKNEAQQRIFSVLFYGMQKEHIKSALEDMRNVFPMDVEANALRAFLDMEFLEH